MGSMMSFASAASCSSVGGDALWDSPYLLPKPSSDTAVDAPFTTASPQPEKPKWKNAFLFPKAKLTENKRVASTRASQGAKTQWASPYGLPK